MAFKFIKPTAFVKAAHLLDSNAGETVALWNSGTTYASAQQARYADSIYASAQGSNTNHTPPTTGTMTDAWWVRVGPSNVTAMFDQQTSTQTVKASPLSVALAVGVCDSLALVGIEGASQITVTGTRGVGGTQVYSQTKQLSDDSISSWYEWFFAPAGEQLGEAVFTGIPPYPDLVLSVTLTGSTVKVGTCVFGMIHEFGYTRAGARFGIIDFSRKDTDEFGATTFVQRAYSKRLSLNVVVDNAYLRAFRRRLASLRATPTLWIASEDPLLADALIVYGFYRDMSGDIVYVDHTLCSLEIEGLT